MKIVKKYSIKIILIMLVLVLLISSFYNVKAKEPKSGSSNPYSSSSSDSSSGSSSGSSGSDYIDMMSKTIEDSSTWSSDSNAVEKTTNLFTAAIVAVKIVAVTIAIIMLLVLAMKYMTSAPGEKAEVKKHAIVYVVGAVILFSTTGILTIIQNFSSSLD